MMAALIHPDRRVLAVCGDGGFMMNSQELETAVRLGLNLVVLVLQDDAYGMIRWKQAVDELVDFGMTFGNPDFVAYAQAYGAEDPGWSPPRTSSRYCRRRSSEAASTSWCPIDYSENTRVLVDELRNRVPARRSVETRRGGRDVGPRSHLRGARPPPPPHPSSGACPPDPAGMSDRRQETR